jgi:hypothetical protein
MEQIGAKEEQKCTAINNIWEVLGRRWALLILKNLHKSYRYSDNITCECNYHHHRR